MPGEVLQVVSGPLTGQRVPIGAGLVFGREEQGFGALGADTGLSRRHARIFSTEDGQIVLEDLGSTNGTGVNGTRINGGRVLRPGDRIQLGASTLELQAGPTAGGQLSTAGKPLPPIASGAVAPRGARGRALPIAGVALLVVLVAAAIVVVATRSGSSGGGTAAANACVRADNGRSGPGHFRYLTSVCENSSSTVATFPLHRGVSGGKTVWYVITDSSNAADARARGVNFAPKLANAARVPGAVEHVTTGSGGVVNFPATVDFRPQRVVVPGPHGFPPAKVAPPAVGGSGYSPLVRLPNGTVLDAPQVANNTGRADKVLRLDTAHGKVDYKETEGRYEDKHVHYASFEASIPAAAALEDVTLAPSLNKIPKPGDEGLKTSGREELDAIVNGPTGASNPQRQGLDSALLDKREPHNILHETPTLPKHPDVGDVAYSPVWDVHLSQWSPKAVASGDRVELASTDEVLARVKSKLITGPGGKAFGASGFAVICPLISIDLP